MNLASIKLTVAPCMALLAAWLAGGGCSRSVPSGALVLTQTPTAPVGQKSEPDILEARYPVGSRVVLVVPPYRPADIRLLSRGLVAAGSPVVCPSGKRILFVGRWNAAAPWQIYEAKLTGGRPRCLTSVAGGAMDPAFSGDDELIFSSPVPKAAELWTGTNRPALYAQAADSPPHRLTWGARAAVEPTVLSDGRILFVSATPGRSNPSDLHLSLFTINNDGTELTAFAGQHDGSRIVHRPRELFDGRIGFLAANSDIPGDQLQAEGVRTARPFLSRAGLFPFATSRCLSIEPGADGGLLVCCESRGLAGRSMNGSAAVFEIQPGAKGLGEALFDDPGWNDLEASRVAARIEPMGHISAMAPSKKTGTLLCLNANYTARHTPTAGNLPAAKRVRVSAGVDLGKVQVLGEIEVEADGSFMVDVPADVPLGFETLDDQGAVIGRVPPFLWVRSGENRSCIGCHEPHNHSPRNHRPIAATRPPAVLVAPPRVLAQKAP